MPPVSDSAAATEIPCARASSPTRSARRAWASSSTGSLPGPSAVSLPRECTGHSYPIATPSTDPLREPDGVERGVHLHVVVEVDVDVATLRPVRRGRGDRVLTHRRLPAPPPPHALRPPV